MPESTEVRAAAPRPRRPEAATPGWFTRLAPLSLAQLQRPLRFWRTWVALYLVLKGPRLIALMMSSIMRWILRALTLLLGRMLREFWLEIRYGLEQTSLTITDIEAQLVDWMESWMGCPVLLSTPSKSRIRHNQQPCAPCPSLQTRPPGRAGGNSLPRLRSCRLRGLHVHPPTWGFVKVPIGAESLLSS